MTIHLRRRARLVPLLLLSASQLLTAQPRMSVSANPRFTFQPGNAVVTVTIEQNAENRALLIEADGPDFYTGSTRELAGASSPRVQRFNLKALPPGAYVIAATLVHADGTETRAVTTIDVLESAALAAAQSRQSRVRPLRPGR
jgi:hypothetical protein